MNPLFRSSGNFSDIATINIVPIVGLLAALMVLFMVTLPEPARQFEVDNARGCVFGPDSRHTHTINMHLMADAQATESIYKDNYPAMLDSIQLTKENSNHVVNVLLDVDEDVNYGELTAYIAELKAEGLADNQIIISY